MLHIYSLEPGETPSNSASRQAPNYVQYIVLKNIVKHDEIMTKNQFYRNRNANDRNRKFRQFNNDQYCSKQYEFRSDDEHRCIWYGSILVIAVNVICKR